MSASPLSDAFVELAVTTRNGHDESVHYGAVVALEPDGSVAFSLGDAGAVVFPRSSTKPSFSKYLTYEWIAAVTVVLAVLGTISCAISG